MDVRNCRGCKRLFNYLSGPYLCQACREKLEKKFQEVKEYVRDNKDASVAVVSEVCEVSVKQIKQWVREERLVFSNEEGSGIFCERCGAPIATGKYCLECKNNLGNTLRGALDKPKAEVQQKEVDRMRFIRK